ncbi:FAM208A [Bugula neritina]|uniref:FAM208A n=1 Tax=Bugula neritina TaxID=10212 RepID=A0A7J7JMW6_BUGNE|nr:FAM208A [Bugula neritina]
MELSITKLSKPSPSFDVFQNTVFESLDTEKKECFEICEVYEVNNSCLQHKFDQLQKCWQAEWRDKEDCTNVCYGYLDVSAESEEAVMAACRHGLGCGNIEKSVLGDPHKAVQLSRHADVVQYKYRNNYQRTLLMFKLMKGKVEHLPSKKQKVTNSSIVAQSEPESKFNTLIASTSYSADQSYEMFYLSKLWYIRHYNEDSQLSAKPPQVCPVALVEVRCGVTQSYNTEGFSIQRLLSTYPEAHKPIAQVNLTKDQELLSPHTEICPIFENIERLKDEDKIVVADLVKTPNESMVNLAGGGLNKSIDKLAEKAAEKS